VTNVSIGTPEYVPEHVPTPGVGDVEDWKPENVDEDMSARKPFGAEEKKEKEPSAADEAPNNVEAPAETNDNPKPEPKFAMALGSDNRWTTLEFKNQVEYDAEYKEYEAIFWKKEGGVEFWKHVKNNPTVIKPQPTKQAVILARAIS
jgi:hypothetical protein